jgi:hydroxymethylpyrimidine/phosphomethylpyrimidine kinase
LSSICKVLTIAGSDSGGGAGIQADLKTFQELGVYGMTAITAVTAQNTVGVQGIFPLSAEALERQLQSIGEDLTPDSVKTGMLHSAEIIHTVAEAIRKFGWRNIVIDPVMLAKGGDTLLQEDAVDALRRELLPLAEVVTPNIPEAEKLTGMRITGRESRLEAALTIRSFGPKHVIIKGGHDDADKQRATDLLLMGETVIEYSSERIDTKHTHGTGCSFASAIAAGLAQGIPLSEAVMQAKGFIQAAISHSLSIGSGHGPTNHWAYNQLRRGNKFAPIEVKTGSVS